MGGGNDGLSVAVCEALGETLTCKIRVEVRNGHLVDGWSSHGWEVKLPRRQLLPGSNTDSRPRVKAERLSPGRMGEAYIGSQVDINCRFIDSTDAVNKREE